MIAWNFSTTSGGSASKTTCWSPTAARASSAPAFPEPSPKSKKPWATGKRQSLATETRRHREILAFLDRRERIFIRSGEPQDHENSVVNKALEFFLSLGSHNPRASA